jgi:hypothetical protein
MKKFFVVYHASAEAVASWKSMDEATMKAGMKQWQDWLEAHASKFSDKGATLGKTKQVNMQGVTDSKNDLIGYAVVEAESHEAAANMFVDHPNAKMAGGSVEVIELIDMPKV